MVCAGASQHISLFIHSFHDIPDHLAVIPVQKAKSKLIISLRTSVDQVLDMYHNHISKDKPCLNLIFCEGYRLCADLICLCQIQESRFN